MAFEFKYRKFAKALYWALREDAFYLTLEQSVGSDQSQQEAMFRYMEFSMIEGERYGELIFPEHHEHGVSIWSKPVSDELEKTKSKEKRSFLNNHMGPESLTTYDNIVSFMADKSDECIGRDAWYLSILGILPGFQGRGLGAELVTTVLQKTDQLNATTYLETFTAQNMTFYYRLGYRERACIHEPTTDTDYWIMARDPLEHSAKIN